MLWAVSGERHCISSRGGSWAAMVEELFVEQTVCDEWG